MDRKPRLAVRWLICCPTRCSAESELRLRLPGTPAVPTADVPRTPASPSGSLHSMEAVRQ